MRRWSRSASALMSRPRIPDRLLRASAAEQQLGRGEDGGDRRPQLVRHDAHERLLQRPRLALRLEHPFPLLLGAAFEGDVAVDAGEATTLRRSFGGHPAFAAQPARRAVRADGPELRRERPKGPGCLVDRGSDALTILGDDQREIRHEAVPGVPIRLPSDAQELRAQVEVVPFEVEVPGTRRGDLERGVQPPLPVPQRIDEIGTRQGRDGVRRDGRDEPPLGGVDHRIAAPADDQHTAHGIVAHRLRDERRERRDGGDVAGTGIARPPLGRGHDDTGPAADDLGGRQTGVE